MATIQIDDLGTGGVVTDLPAHEAPINAFTADLNMRVVDGGLERTKGHTPAFSVPIVAPHILQPWQAINIFYWLYADANRIFRTDGSTHEDVTRGKGVGSISFTSDPSVGTEINVGLDAPGVSYLVGDKVTITGAGGTPDINGIHTVVTRISDVFFRIDIGTSLTVQGTTGTVNFYSPYTGATYPLWNGGVLGGVPVLNHHNQSDPPQNWSGAAGHFIDLLNWPVGSGGDPTWYAKVIRPFKTFLVALYMTEDGTDYPTRLRWSDAADPGAVPPEWIPATTNLAGDVSFSDTTDHLVDMLPLGDANIVYKEEVTYLMQFVGGNNVFSFRKIFTEFGALSQRCMKTVRGRHIVLTKGDVIAHNGQQWDSIITRKRRKELFATLSVDNFENAFLREYPEKQELWVCLPENGSAVASCTTAFIWNYQYNSWTQKELPGLGSIGLGIIDLTGAEIFSDLTGTFDAREGAFTARKYNPTVAKLLYGEVETPQLYQVDVTDQADGTDYTSKIERTGLTLVDGKTVDPFTIKFVRAIYPRIMADPGVTVEISIGSQAHPDAPPIWSTPVSFDPHTEKKVNVRVSGELIGVRFSSSSGGQWKLHSYGLEMDIIGEQ